MMPAAMWQQPLLLLVPLTATTTTHDVTAHHPTRRTAQSCGKQGQLLHAACS